MEDRTPAFDALILAGGRASRLGGTAKQDLMFEGASLLDTALAAASGARRTAVVGPRSAGLPPHVLSCREQPEFAGPAAAIAAGLDALDRDGDCAAYTLVLACDMPMVARAVQALLPVLAAAAPAHTDGVVSCTPGPEGSPRLQPLAAFYSTGALKKSVRELTARGGLINGPVRALLASLDLQLVPVPNVSTADVDTWADAAALGIATGTVPGSGGQGSGTDIGGNRHPGGRQ
jgi:molybdopterin-guanine dinucleotide biosynthesis protein A